MKALLHRNRDEIYSDVHWRNCFSSGGFRWRGRWVNWLASTASTNTGTYWNFLEYLILLTNKRSFSSNFINLKFLEVWVFIYTFALDTANIRHESAWKYFILEFSCFKGNVFYFTCKKIIFKNLGNSMRRKIIYHLCNMINFSIFDNYLHQKCVLSPSFSFSYYSTHPSPHYPHLSLGLRQ